MYPILFKIGPINLYTYGFFLSLGFLVAILVAGREAKRLGLPEEHFYDLCFYIILAAIVGSRLLFVLVSPGPFLQNPLKIFAIWEGGLVFHGGLYHLYPAVQMALDIICMCARLFLIAT